MHGNMELSLGGLQAAYWWQFDHGEALTVEYGNDVEGTAFAAPDSADPLGKTKWNLQVCRKLHIIVNLELHPQCYLSLLMHSYKFLLKHSLVDREQCYAAYTTPSDWKWRAGLPMKAAIFCLWLLLTLHKSL